MEAGRPLTWVLQMHAGAGKQTSRAALSPTLWGAPGRKGTGRGAAGPAPAWRSHRRWGHAESSAARVFGGGNGEAGGEGRRGCGLIGARPEPVEMAGICRPEPKRRGGIDRGCRWEGKRFFWRVVWCNPTQLYLAINIKTLLNFRLAFCAYNSRVVNFILKMRVSQ
jgi:hypothetical protein